MSRSFAAAYRGICAECDGPIEPGQSVCFTAVARRGGDLRHMVCPDDGPACNCLFGQRDLGFSPHSDMGAILAAGCAVHGGQP